MAVPSQRCSRGNRGTQNTASDVYLWFVQKNVSTTLHNMPVRGLSKVIQVTESFFKPKVNVNSICKYLLPNKAVENQVYHPLGIWDGGCSIGVSSTQIIQWLEFKRC